MTEHVDPIERVVQGGYEAGWITEIDSDTLPPGLDEDVIRFISARKQEPEWLLEWRLKAFRHWQTMAHPTWAHVHYRQIDYQGISYYSAPRRPEDGPQSLDEVDPKLLETYQKLSRRCSPGWRSMRCSIACRW